MSETQPLAEIGQVVRRTIGSRNYYLGTLASDKLKNLTFVPVVESSTKTYVNESTEEGYQRPGSISRMRQFMRFLEKHDRSVVPPVLLSGRGAWKFEVDDEGPLGVLVVHGPAAIIDGQHRIGGYIALYEDQEVVRPVDFILLNDLERDAEMEEFVVVNSTQRGVPKPLTEYLSERDEAQIAWALNVTPDSPFFERITRVSMKRTNLFALHSVAKQMTRLFGFGALADLDVETKIEYAIRYFTIIADSLPIEWSDVEKLDDPNFRGRSDFEYKLLELTGLIAWSLVGKSILGRSYSEGAGMNWDNVRRLVEAVKVIDWRKKGQYQGLTGEVGGAEIAREMERLLPPENAADEDDVEEPLVTV